MRVFILHVDPVPKGRPRFNQKTKKIYTPDRTKTFQDEVRKQVCLSLGQYFDYPMFDKDVPVCVDVDFVFKRTQALNKKRYDDGLMWKNTGEDKDNLEKAVFDALNGILWEDDRQIVDGRTRKLWGRKNKASMICLAVRTAGEPPYTTCNNWGASGLEPMTLETEDE